MSASYAAARAQDPELGFTEWLRRQAEPHWTAMTTHRFARELGAGTLPRPVMARYLQQDYLFVDAFVSLLGQAVAQAPGMPSKRRFAGFLAAVTSGENDYFLRAFEALGVSEEDWRHATPHPVTAAFLDLLRQTNESGRYASIVAVLLAAEWSYLTWAQACPPEKPEAFWLSEWIDLHAEPAFLAFVGWLRAECEVVGEAADEATRGEMAGLFRRMMALEEAFFEAAYQAG